MSIVVNYTTPGAPAPPVLFKITSIVFDLLGARVMAFDIMHVTNADKHHTVTKDGAATICSPYHN